ncbi:MAG: caspase family protein [Rhodobacteraceae bacterium]|nr:caspase family protein [Paracoccaceae bacterium]
MRQILLSFLLVALASPLFATTSCAESRALLIGINAYPIKPLKGPLNDVADMQVFVQSDLGFKPEQIRVLRDSAANYAAIKRGIEEWLIAGTNPGDRAFLYFAGHGTQIEDLNDDEINDGLDEVLLPIDFAADDGRFLTDDYLAEALDALSDRKVTVIIDACNSGTISRTLSSSSESPATARYLPVGLTRGLVREATERPPSPDDLRDALSDSAMIDSSNENNSEIWMASAAYQQTFEGSFNGKRHGVLTRAFLEANSGVADQNGNGRVSRSEILDHIRKRAAQFCKSAEACHSNQKTLTPILEAPPALRGLPLSEWPAPDQTPSLSGQSSAREDAAQLPPPEQTRPAEATSTSAPEANKTDALTDLVQGGGLPTAVRLSPFEGDLRGSVNAGDRFAVEVTSDAAGQLLLYIAPDDGDITQLFPLSISQKNTRLKPRTPIRVPTLDYGFKLVMPKGTGTLLAIVAADEAAIQSLDPLVTAPEATSAPRSLRGQAHSLAQIMASLGKPIAEGLENRGGRYGIATLRYGE